MYRLIRRELVLFAIALTLLATGIVVLSTSETVQATAERWSGSNRYATAAQVAVLSWPSGTEVVRLATGDQFPDALAASAAQPPGPVLLTQRDVLPRESCEALAQLKPSRVVAIGGAAVISDGVLGAAHSCSQQAPTDVEGQFLQLINHERTARGLSVLPSVQQWTEHSRAHSRRMASEGRMFHSAGPPADGTWQGWGENIARGNNVDAIHANWMASPTHRANILDPAWDEVGVGVSIQDGELWVTQTFIAK